MPTVPLLASVADLSASVTSGGASQLVPTGTVFPFAGSTAPTGWLLCNGQSVSQTTYADLYNALGGAASPYGGVSGGNFAVPDCRGIFISGTGSQAIGGITYTRTHGAKQGDLMQGHAHRVNANNGAVGGFVTALANNLAASSDIGTSAAQTDGTNGTPRTGAETRPANIAMNYIIKT